MAKKLIFCRYGDKGAIFGPEEVLIYFAKKESSEAKTLHVVKDYDLKNLFPKKKNDKDLQDSFTKSWDEFKKDGTIKAIFKKYSLKD